MTSNSRTVKTSLVTEVSGYIAGYQKAAKATRDLGTEAEKLAAKKDAINQLGTGLLAIGAVAAVGVGLAVKAFAEFDQAMSNVKAATQETTANMGLLREAALDAGASSVFTATEAANAIEELGKAGLTTQQILEGGLDGALALASAGALGVAEAAQIAAISVKQFGLDGADVPHVADLLAAGAGKAVGSVQDLGSALGQAGLVANQTGLSIEETTGVLAAFADKGLLGSDAGTSLKTMLQSLVPSSAAAREEMERLGISAYDANGEFIGAAAFAGNYSNALKDLTPQQQAATAKIIFGSDAVRAANVFYDLGAEGIQKYIDQTNDSGYAAQVAADRLDNLSGDVEKLGGSFETALIKSGSGANDVLRGLTQSATFLVDAFGSVPTPILNTGLAVAGVTAAVALAGGAALVAVPKIAAFKTNLDTLGISGKKAAIGVGVVAGALSAGVLAFSLWASEQATAAGVADEFAGSLDSTTGALTDYTRELVKKKLAESGAFDAARDVGVSQKELTDAVLSGGSALDKIRDKIGGNTAVWKLFSAEGITAGKALDGITKATDGLEQGKKNVNDMAAAGDGAADSAEALAEKTKVAEEATAAATEAQQEYIASLAELDSSFISLGGGYDTLIQKNQDVAQATADATKSSDDSWTDYYDGFSFSLADYLAELQTMVDAQNNWESNMVLLSGKVSQGVLDELAKLGPEGAELVAGLTTASDEELSKLEELYGEKGAAATAAFANTLLYSGDVIRAASAQLGQEAAEEIAAKLANGTSTVEQIIADYKLTVEGFVPVVDANTSIVTAKIDALKAAAAVAIGVLAGLNTPAPNVNPAPFTVPVEPNAVGNIHEYANGGFPSGIYAGRAGGIHKFAEPETGWETYLSGKPSARERNIGLWAKTGDMLGVPAPTYMPATERQYASSSSSSSTKTIAPNINISGDGMNARDAAEAMAARLSQLSREP